jgi:hypothetical protein
MSKKSKMKVEDILPIVVEPVVMMETPKKTRKKKEMKETEVQLIVPESELNRNYDKVESKPEKETKSKKVNPWISHIKDFASKNGLTYNKAMLDPLLKSSYAKTSKGKVDL